MAHAENQAAEASDREAGRKQPELSAVERRAVTAAVQILKQSATRICGADKFDKLYKVRFGGSTLRCRRCSHAQMQPVRSL